MMAGELGALLELGPVLRDGYESGTSFPESLVTQTIFSLPLPLPTPVNITFAGGTRQCGFY
jgi:hypothetical protein